MRLQQIIEKHEVKYNPVNPHDDEDDGDDGDGDDEPPTPRRAARFDRHRDRGRETNNNMKDASALRPGTLDITMTSLAINTWFDDFNSYRFASGWSSGPHHVQKAYLKNVLSEEIQIAIDFRHIGTIDEILRVTKDYLERTVTPIELTRLEALRYRGPPGQSQTATTNSTMQLYRNAEMHMMSGEDIMKLGAINSVTDREIMKELTKDLRNLTTYQEIVERITLLDKSNVISNSLLETQKKHYSYQVNSAFKKIRCQRCGKTDHNIKECKIKPEDIKCDHCQITGHLKKVCRKLAAEKAENKVKKDDKGKRDDRNTRSSRSRSRSRSRSTSGNRLQTPKYPRSRDNSSSREKSEHSNCLQFLLKEEIESDTSDSEENTTDTDETEDKYYTPVESPHPPQLITDSEDSDSESESSDPDDDFSYWNNTFNISNTSDETNDDKETDNEQDSSSSEEETKTRGRSSRKTSYRNRRPQTPRRKSSYPRRRPKTPAPRRACSPNVSEEEHHRGAEPVKWKIMSDSELEIFINDDIDTQD